MGKRVILTLMPGSFEQGFAVILRIEDGTLAEPRVQVLGQLPPAPHIWELFKQWQLAYRQIVISHSRLKPKLGQVTNFSCHQLGSDLAEHLNDWLNSGHREWQKIRDRLQQNLSETDEILVIIETDDLRLRQLPWHLWDFLSRHYTKAEIALSTPDYQPLINTAAPRTDKVRILAILGNSTGIDVQKDRAILQQLPNAETTFLIEPQRQELNNQLWEQQWDILFFAGHSSSQMDGETGQIYINQTDSLSLAELKNALRRAIEQGLQLAIFNSCDGLGLARELASLHIPQIVVMREPVPDLVAQEFLQHFLITFAGGKSLYLAVREARERLQGLEGRFPCATWLPVICQNPAQVAPTWQDLHGCAKSDSTISIQPQNRQVPRQASRLKTVLFLSGVITALVLGVRHLGLLQPLELTAFDQLMRLRPDEGPDRRLLIVKITEDDFTLPQQQQRQGSLSDQALALLLQKLVQFKPRAIGLDIYRDFPTDSKQLNLAAEIQRNPNFFAVCKASEPKIDEPGVAPPPEIPSERQGFSDFVKDPDGLVRRHLIAMRPGSTSPCTTPYALSARLAFRYLEAEGISAKYIQTSDLQIGKVVFKRWRSRMGGYQNVDDWGYQVLLNYRSYGSPLEVAEQVTLKDVLTGSLSSEVVKDRIVLIGITAQSAGDFFLTPYTIGQQPYQEMPGVLIHAQMVSQMLSAVLNGRTLLWVWPAWGEALWVCCWSVLGGMLVWRIRNPLHLGLVGAAAFGVLYGFSFGLITQGGWIPLVPSALALIVTGGSVVIYRASQARRSNTLEL